MTIRDRGQYRTNPAIGFELVSRTDTFVTRPALDHAGWKCEACRNDDQLRVCVDRKHRLVVLCSGCRTTPDEFKNVLIRRTYSFKPIPRERT